MEEKELRRKRTLVLINIVLVTFMATLQGSIIDVALPTMARSLSVSTESISWVVTTFLIVVTSTILIFGKLGDMKGKSNIFLAGLALFTVGSLFCGISWSFPLLIISRVVQGIGAAAAMANNQGIIAQTFPKNERGRALGISGSFVALGSMVGPPLGGFIISVISWNYIFLINVPIGIVVFLMGRKLLPADENASEEKLDGKGAALLASAIGIFFLALTVGRSVGFTNPWIIGGFAVTLLAAIAFFLIEGRIEKPLLQLSIFKNRLFSLSIFCAFTSFVALSSVIIIQPFYLQFVLKYPPAQTGLIMTVSPLVLFVVAPVSGRLSDRIGSEFLTCLGLILSSTGLFLMSTLTEYSPLTVLVLFILIMSCGNGLFQSPNTSLIMSSVTHDKMGIAGSLNAFVRNLGMVVGTTLAIILLYDFMSLKLGYRVDTLVLGYESAFVYGMRFVYITAGTVCGVGALLTAYRLYSIRRRKAALKQAE